MIKGHARIELTNVETGEVEVHEDDNLITNAVNYIMSMDVAAFNHQPNDYVLPIATRLLGGIMLFDGELEESADNINFPTDVHLVGYANQDTNTSDKYRGSYNAAESGKTDSGYKSVWDFGTSQANGTIKAVARTNNYGGAQPLRYFINNNRGSRRSGVSNTDSGWVPVRYEDEYVYMIKCDSNTHVARIAKARMPLLKMGSGNYSSDFYSYEVIASWDTELYHYTSNRHQYDRYYYADNAEYYKDGKDGYLYVFCGDGDSSDSEQGGNNTTIHYFRVKYDDGSFEREETVELDIKYTYYYTSTSNYIKYFSRHIIWVNNGIFYIISRDRKQIYLVDPNNIAAMRIIRLIPSDNEDYILNIQYVSPYKGGIFITIYHYTDDSYVYRNGILYPDGTYVIPEIAGVNPTNTSDYNWLHTNDEDLTAFGTEHWNGYNYYFDVGWAANYLGTINNLSSAITKTAAQTMKIIYTLTDVD